MSLTNATNNREKLAANASIRTAAMDNVTAAYGSLLSAYTICMGSLLPTVAGQSGPSIPGNNCTEPVSQPDKDLAIHAYNQALVFYQSAVSSLNAVPSPPTDGDIALANAQAESVQLSYEAAQAKLVAALAGPIPIDISLAEAVLRVAQDQFITAQFRVDALQYPTAQDLAFVRGRAPECSDRAGCRTGAARRHVSRSPIGRRPAAASIGGAGRVSSDPGGRRAASWPLLFSIPSYGAHDRHRSRRLGLDLSPAVARDRWETSRRARSPPVGPRPRKVRVRSLPGVPPLPDLFLWGPRFTSGCLRAASEKTHPSPTRTHGGNHDARRTGHGGARSFLTSSCRGPRFTSGCRRMQTAEFRVSGRVRRGRIASGVKGEHWCYAARHES